MLVPLFRAAIHASTPRQCSLSQRPPFRPPYRFIVVDPSDFLLSCPDGPEQKRKIIGDTFINGKIDWPLQGTLYPDIIKSISFKGPSATIKTHHNVDGLLKDMKLNLIELLRELIKDEVPALGRLLHPRFARPVTCVQVQLLQRADVIYLEEIRAASLYQQISQAFAVLLPVRAVGVNGVTYGVTSKGCVPSVPIGTAC
ncbi:hypothetical protein EDB86DRAFT_3078936 [Lactarius hatsudake]|nr:hypothetical protein EDB86DRAFT_3078936 [Lactarius hatsudake]